jgi:translation elongation factor EF-Ts
VQACARALAQKLAGIDFNCLVTAEAKSIPLVHALSVETGVPYVVLRKRYKPYMGVAMSAETNSITTGQVYREVIEKEREIYRGQLADQKKPAQVLDKIIEGKLEKFFTEQCLLEQPFVKDASGKTKVRELVDGVNAKTGERIVVKRFARFQVGEGG